MQHRTTLPVQQREQGDIKINQDNVADPHHEDQLQIGDRGGVEDINQPPPAENDQENALKTASIIESVNYVYGTSKDFIPFIEAYEIGFEIAASRLFCAC